MAEEGQTRAVAKSLPKSQPSPVSVKPARLLPRRAAFSRTILSAAPGDSRRCVQDPRTAAQGPGPVGESVLSAVHLSGVAKPLCPCPEGNSCLRGGRGRGWELQRCQADFIQKLPSWWETAVPQFDLFKEYSVLMRFFKSENTENTFYELKGAQCTKNSWSERFL